MTGFAGLHKAKAQAAESCTKFCFNFGKENYIHPVFLLLVSTHSQPEGIVWKTRSERRTGVCFSVKSGPTQQSASLMCRGGFGVGRGFGMSLCLALSFWILSPGPSLCSAGQRISSFSHPSFSRSPSPARTNRSEADWMLAWG